MRRNDGSHDCLGFRGTSSGVCRACMSVSGHLRNRQGMSLLTDFRARPMKRRVDCARALTNNTEDTTCRIREVKGRPRSTELVSDYIIKERILRLGQRSTIAFHPAQMVCACKGHFDIARDGLLVCRKGRGTTKNGSHGSTRNNILLLPMRSLTRCHGDVFFRHSSSCNASDAT